MKVAEATREQLELALCSSVRMQAHYATLLNMHDGGERRTFDSADAWLTRLEEVAETILNREDPDPTHRRKPNG